MNFLGWDFSVDKIFLTFYLLLDFLGEQKVQLLISSTKLSDFKHHKYCMSQCGKATLSGTTLKFNIGVPEEDAYYEFWLTLSDDGNLNGTSL